MKRRLSPKTALLTCHILSGCFAAVFLLFMILTASKDIPTTGKLLLFSALLFALVSLLRHLIGAKRPYEEKKDAPPPRRGSNDSFPSRHAYSAFFIATLTFRLSPLLSYCLFPAAILLAFLRVLGGVHHPRDVVAGAFFGVLCAIIVLVLI